MWMVQLWLWRGGKIVVHNISIARSFHSLTLSPTKLSSNPDLLPTKPPTSPTTYPNKRFLQTHRAHTFKSLLPNPAHAGMYLSVRAAVPSETSLCFLSHRSHEQPEGSC